MARMASAGLKRPHAHHHRSPERAGGLRRDRGAVHGDIVAAGDMPERNAGGEQRLLEGEGAADDEGDEIVAPIAPQPRRARRPARRCARRGISACRWRYRGRGQARGCAAAAGLGHAEQRAGLWIALGKAQEIGGKGLGQHARDCPAHSRARPRRCCRSARRAAPPAGPRGHRDKCLSPGLDFTQR